MQSTNYSRLSADDKVKLQGPGLKSKNTDTEKTKIYG